MNRAPTRQRGSLAEPMVHSVAFTAPAWGKGEAMGARCGADYVAGLRDGREVWIDGERVHDVTRDRRLGRGIRSVAALYDLQLEPARVEQMTYASPTTGDRVGLSHIE